MGQHVGYGRVSTASGEQLSALDGQLQWLQGQECSQILHDVESGLVVERAGYGRLLALIEGGAVTTLSATRADRLGRDAPELVRLVQLCDRAGVTVLTRDDGRLSARTAEELLLLYVRAALAQGESMKISQRVRGGLAEGRAIGKPMRKPCWGYRLRADRLALEPDPEAWLPAQRFIDQLQWSRWRMHATLAQHRDIVPFRSLRGVKAWLVNPTLRGGIGYGQTANHRFSEVLWDRHPALLTHGQFAEFEQALAMNRRLWGRNAVGTPRLLTGLCECAECGYRLKYISGRTVASLRCNGDLCSQLYKGTRENVIVRFTLDAIASGAAERLAAMATQDEPPEVRKLRASIEALERLGDADLAPVIATKTQRLESLLKRPALDGDLVRRLADRRLYDLLSAEELRPLLVSVVERVTVTRQEPTAIRLKL